MSTKLEAKEKQTLEKLSALWPDLTPIQRAYFLGKADGFTEAEMLAKQKGEPAPLPVQPTTQQTA